MDYKSLSEIQSETAVWAKRNFGISFTSTNNLLGIVEEVGELCHVVLKRNQMIRGVSQDDEEDAIGDILIFLLNYCNCRNIDITKVLNETWARVSKRDWKANPQTGEVNGTTTA